jgi:hypothetical protein
MWILGEDTERERREREEQNCEKKTRRKVLGRSK